MKRGFTLIELLVVIAIIGLLASIVFQSLASARSKSRVAAGQVQDASIFTTTSGFLVGEWNFEEADGAAPPDTSGSGNNASVVGTLNHSPGIKGQALNFPGVVGNYISVPVPATSFLKVGQPHLTITAWINPTFAGGGSQQIVGMNGPYLLWVDAVNHRVQTGINQTGATWYWSYSGNNTLQAGQWQFVVMTYDGTTRNIYINGALQGSDTQISGPITAVYAGVLGIGEDPCCGGVRPFAGLIDEVRIYSGSLSLSAIEKLYAQGAARRGLATDILK